MRVFSSWSQEGTEIYDELMKKGRKEIKYKFKYKNSFILINEPQSLSGNRWGEVMDTWAGRGNVAVSALYWQLSNSQTPQWWTWPERCSLHFYWNSGRHSIGTFSSFTSLHFRGDVLYLSVLVIPLTSAVSVSLTTIYPSPTPFLCYLELKKTHLVDILIQCDRETLYL